MVIHRTLREGDPTFREELINYSRSRGHLLNLSNFKDDSSPNGENQRYVSYGWGCRFSVIVGCVIFYCVTLSQFLLLPVLQTSLGLFCLGADLCAVSGGASGVFSCIEV